MKLIVELRNRAQVVADELDAIAQRGHEMTADDSAKMDALMSEATELRGKIEAELASERRIADAQRLAADTRQFISGDGLGESRGAPPMPDVANERAVLSSSGRSLLTRSGDTFIQIRSDGSYEITNTGRGLLSMTQYARIDSREYADAFMEYVQKGGNMQAISAASMRALQEGLDDEGGFLVPPEIALRLIQREPTPVSLNPRFFAWQTTRDAVIFPKVNYTGATDDPNAVLYTTGVRLTYPGEIPNDQNTINAVQPAFGETRIPVYTAMMALDVSRNMIDDSPTRIMNMIESKFRETAALEYDNRAIIGTGVNQASGMIGAGPPVSVATSTSLPQYIPSQAAGALTADGIKALAFGLAPQYAMRACFFMNWMGTAQAISELKDGQGRYLWSDGQQDNGLSASILNRRLLGFEAIYSEFMPQIAANAFPIGFGDLLGYYLVQRLGISIQILFETKAKQNMLEVIARLRFGGLLAEPWRVKLQKVGLS
jgi:HK97 family phage major capsid protein